MGTPRRGASPSQSTCPLAPARPSGSADAACSVRSKASMSVTYHICFGSLRDVTPHPCAALSMRAWHKKMNVPTLFKIGLLRANEVRSAGRHFDMHMFCEVQSMPDAVGEEAEVAAPSAAGTAPAADGAAGGCDAGEAAALRARVRQLEVEAGLMQRELDAVSDAAQRSEAQLR